MGVNRLPKTVIRQRPGCDLNTGPSALDSSTLTTRLPSYQGTCTLRVHYYSVAPNTGKLAVLLSLALVLGCP